MSSGKLKRRQATTRPHAVVNRRRPVTGAAVPSFGSTPLLLKQQLTGALKETGAAISSSIAT